MAGLVVLLSDFGLTDPYLGQMKGALLAQAPDARLVDLCHQVEPFDISQAGFFLAASHGHFPAGTAFVSVVDPGVGTSRGIILLKKFGQFFLAPDNGLLTLIMHKAGEASAFQVAGPWPEGASPTFHGRDIFAPLAGRLATGATPQSLGQGVTLEGLVRLPGLRPVLTGQVLSAVVLHVDRFGNCLLNLETSLWADRLARAKSLSMASAKNSVQWVRTYQDMGPGQIGLLAGSQGYLELAVRQAKAAEQLGLARGSQVNFTLEAGD